eukprot:scaffold232416_cov23-Tisochrysis_lutea.AAC.1
MGGGSRGVLELVAARAEVGGRVDLVVVCREQRTELCVFLFPTSVAGVEERARVPCRRPDRAGRRPASTLAPSAWGVPVGA